MSNNREVVITGVGVFSPIGIGPQAFWDSLARGQSGVRRLELFARCGHDAPLGAAIADFDPKKHVRIRKALKVMSRDIQLGFAAADAACVDAGVGAHPVDPERTGVVMGADMIACELEELEAPYRRCIEAGTFSTAHWGEAMKDIYPLWMLKYLPNMAACHIGIAEDFRGPTNSLVLAEVSSLMAIVEAVRVIERGQADAMVAGGVGARIHPTIWTHDQVYQLSQRTDDPGGACRPFDAARDGTVHGEGAAAFFLETRQSAAARGAVPVARIAGFGTASEPRRSGKFLGESLSGRAIEQALGLALRNSGFAAGQLGHVNAHGIGTIDDDRIEAQAIRKVAGDVPVTAPKSYFGYLGAGGGAVELAASVIGFRQGLVPPTLNYTRPDPACPVNVVHGKPLADRPPTAIKLNHSHTGQAVALAIAGE